MEKIISILCTSAAHSNSYLLNRAFFKQQVNLHNFGFGFGFGMLKLSVSVSALAQTNRNFGTFGLGSNLGFGRSLIEIVFGIFSFISTLSKLLSN